MHCMYIEILQEEKNTIKGLKSIEHIGKKGCVSGNGSLLSLPVGGGQRPRLRRTVSA